MDIENEARNKMELISDAATFDSHEVRRILQYPETAMEHIVALIVQKLEEQGIALADQIVKGE